MSAKNNNVKFGRQAREFPDGWNDDYRKCKAKEITAVFFSKRYNLTFYKKAGKWKEKLAASSGAVFAKGRMELRA